MSLAACLLLKTLIPFIVTKMSFYTQHKNNIHYYTGLAQVCKISAKAVRNHSVEKSQYPGKPSSYLQNQLNLLLRNMLGNMF